MAIPKKKSEAVVRVSRSLEPQASIAKEIDRVCSAHGETVQSVGLKAIQCGLPEAERILQQFKKANP